MTIKNRSSVPRILSLLLWLRVQGISVLLLNSLALAPHAVATTVKTVGRWDRFEATVTNAKRYADPYRDVTLNVTYTRPDRSTIDFWGFYDGGQTWRMRFMPDQLGVWRYRATFSDGSPGTSGTFTCGPSDIPGMISKDETNPLWFGFRGGKHLLVRSFHAGDRFFARNWSSAERTAFLDWVQRQRYNMLSIASHYLRRDAKGRGAGWDTPDLWPLDAAEYRSMEVILDDLAKRRILVYPFAGFFGRASDYPRDEADQNHYIKYTLARIGAYWNILLSVAGPEPNLRKSVYLTSEEINRLAGEIKRHDVFNHLLGVHNQDGDDPYKDSSWSSYVTLQGEYPDLSELNKYFLKNHTGSKPIYAQETLWPGNTLQPFGSADATTIRKHAFVHMMSATALNFGDMDGDSSSGFSGTLDLAKKVQSRHDIVKRVWDFFETVPFYRMSPRQDLVDNGYCLAEEGKHYLVYLETKGTVNVRLAPGTYSVEWVNAQNTSDKRSAGTASTGERLRSPAEGEDWLLQLTLVKGGTSHK